MKTIKALVLHNLGKLAYEEHWPIPEVKDGWARIKVEYCGVCGSDIPRTLITGGYHYPLICGHEFVGLIDKTSSGSTKFKQGERVAVYPLIPCNNCTACLNKEYFHCDSYNFIGSRCDGAFAEYCIAPETNLIPLPPNCDPRSGAFVEPLGVALNVVRQSGFKSGDSALVFGAGPIGILTAQWLKILGASNITLVGRSLNSLATAKRANLENVISIQDELFGQIGNIDYGFECAGSNDALMHLIKKIKRKGIITVIGRDTKDTLIPLKDYELFMRKEMILKGCWGYNADRDTGLIIDTLKNNKINILPLVTNEASLIDGEKIIRDMHRKERYHCKVLFKI